MIYTGEKEFLFISLATSSATLIKISKYIYSLFIRSKFDAQTVSIVVIRKITEILDI